MTLCSTEVLKALEESVVIWSPVPDGKGRIIEGNRTGHYGAAVLPAHNINTDAQFLL